MKNKEYLRLRPLSFSGLVLALVFNFQNCSKVDFTANTALAAARIKPPICSLQNTSENLKILFMVDNSGSTNTTDPLKKYRDLVVQDFLNTYSSKTNFKYSFGYFHAAGYTYDTSPGANTFVNNPMSAWGPVGDLANALQSFLRIGTSNHTYYQEAFKTIKANVASDPSPSGWKYIVIFMSDGQPTDLAAEADGTSQSSITALVKDLLTVKPIEFLTVSSVFFGSPTDAHSIQNLSKMASVGGGDFVDTNLTQNIVISDLVAIPGQNCQ